MHNPWIQHVLQTQRAHNCTFAQALKKAKTTWRKKYRKPRMGKGVVTDAIDKVRNWFFPSNKLPAPSKRIYDKYKGEKVKSIMVRRKPINTMIDKFINLVSLGTFASAKKKLAYDKMFHLSMWLTLESGTVISCEKLERVTLKVNPSPDANTDIVSCPYSKHDTLDVFLDNGENAMGAFKFFQYNAFENNCQDFILGVLKANGAGNNAVFKFIKQDTTQVIKAMPSFVGKLSQFVTDTAGRAGELLGLGKKKRRKRKKKKKA